MYRLLVNSLILFCLLMVSSCDNDDICTLKMVMLTIEIEDSDGNKISVENFAVTNNRTGQALCSVNEDDNSCLIGEQEIPGKYIVITSQNVGSLNEVKKGDTLIVSGTYSGVSFSKEYFLHLDRSGCHPELLVGPEVVVLEGNI